MPNEPKGPTIEQVREWYNESRDEHDPMWTKIDTSLYIHVAQRAYAAGLAISNRERRMEWHECSEWMWNLGVIATPRNAAHEALRRYPDPVPAPVEYTLGGSRYRKHADGLVEWRGLDGVWATLNNAERTALKALATTPAKGEG